MTTRTVRTSRGARRKFLAAALALPFAARAQAPCGKATPADIEGPFYKPGAPARSSLAEPSSKAAKLVLGGTVTSADCRPLAGVALDFWHADADGEYDNRGFRYRGVVTTDEAGRYRLETNLPPPYSGRPRHIHVKLRGPGGRVLTTQLYFPGEARRENPALVVKARRDGAAAMLAEFDFVLPGG